MTSKIQTPHTTNDAGMLSRAQGCLLGQLAGDALGSLVEFQTPEQIRRRYPNGVRELADGGTWNTIAGQPTDDSEMALVLARLLIDQRKYDPQEAREAYIYWLNSGPFDCGATVSRGLSGRANPDSQANGAMMRISPLGIFGAKHPLATPPCPVPGGSRHGNSDEWGRHRYQRGHLWSASRRRSWTGCDSSPVDPVPAELPPRGWTSTCGPSATGVLLAGRCAGTGGGIGFGEVNRGSRMKIPLALREIHGKL